VELRIGHADPIHLLQVITKLFLLHTEKEKKDKGLVEEKGPKHDLQVGQRLGCSSALRTQHQEKRRSSHAGHVLSFYEEKDESSCRNWQQNYETVPPPAWSDGRQHLRRFPQPRKAGTRSIR